MLLQAEQCSLLIIDMQERLMPVIDQGEAVLAANGKLAQAARLLEVPVLATEHHVRALGTTLAPLRDSIDATFQKMAFGAMREPGFEAWLPASRRTLVVTGCEAHVCVLQTVLGLREHGWQVALVADAAGSRKPADHHAALRRMRAAGAQIVTSEMVMFEWMQTCEHPRFREVLRLVK
ncbi:isochorismatase [Bordetella trematum]|uniref:isochorismatase family protein n=1 Tax=Bordetella trematum TaxID=123899 RepID=UPI00079447E8|nr:isochorismatase family protein [Bordetella trematum]SAI57934.1 isochorismatase [Bordetella trematum]